MACGANFQILFSQLLHRRGFGGLGGQVRKSKYRLAFVDSIRADYKGLMHMAAIKLGHLTSISMAEHE